MAAADDMAIGSITELMERNSIKNRMDALRKDVGLSNEVQTEDGTAFTDDFTAHSLLSTLLISINGTGDLPEQKVRVQYLSQSQHLRIPQGLGIDLADRTRSEAANSENLVRLYWTLGSKTLQELWAVANSEEPLAAKRAIVQAWQPANPAPPLPLWMTEGYYVLENGRGRDDTYVSSIFGKVCRMLKLNFDIRDMGALVGATADMRMPDDYWNLPQYPGKERFTSKLKPYTMACIATLNMLPCRNVAVAAWVRSFGVSAGILPTRNTRVNKEWVYTSAGISEQDYRASEGAFGTYGGLLQPLCMNIIALFGLLHLNKNHTFITGDASMDRVGQAFLNTLRVMITPERVEDLKTQQEVIVRTCVHPFGLGQTYATALIMGAAGTLASPLALRTSVTPPLTQRLMIVDAAFKEWQSLPVGATMKVIFGDRETKITDEILLVRARAPAYSELYYYYGLDAFSPVNPNAKEAADSLMPMVYGYAKAFHTAGETSRDGLALAMSFENVLRDNKANAEMCVSMWARYHDQMETGGLEAFIDNAYKLSGVSGTA